MLVWFHHTVNVNFLPEQVISFEKAKILNTHKIYAPTKIKGENKMGRTIEEILVTGRSMKEIGDEVSVWMAEEGIDIQEKRDDFFKGRMGIPGGLGLTAPKYFEITLKQNDKGIAVHTEGWIGVYGVSESSFSKNAFMGGIPRRKGWKTMEKLWTKLRAMSK